MRPRDIELGEEINARLAYFSDNEHFLPGASSPVQREVLVEQILESCHRVKFVRTMRDRDISPERANPQNAEMFNPIQAAAYFVREADPDEASWMTFLYVHFGKSAKGGWRYLRDVYGGLGEIRWSWNQVTADPMALPTWLNENQDQIRNQGVAGGFGNHRKYTSLRSTGEAVRSYVEMILRYGNHTNFFDDALARGSGSPYNAFDYVYRQMENHVYGFGRLALFDYVTMISKLNIATLEPGHPYLKNATGPKNGAKLLFGEGHSTQTLSNLVVSLDQGLGLGMQVWEDSLCNWQKSPGEFVRFRG